MTKTIKESFKENTGFWLRLHNEVGWKLYVFIFCYMYTGFSIFFTTYVWVLVKVFGFHVTGNLLGWEY